MSTGICHPPEPNRIIHPFTGIFNQGRTHVSNNQRDAQTSENFCQIKQQDTWKTEKRGPVPTSPLNSGLVGLVKRTASG